MYREPQLVYDNNNIDKDKVRLSEICAHMSDKEHILGY